MKPSALREKVAKICLALPEVTREDSGDHSGFRVRKKSFAYFLNDHHGDGIVGFCCRVLPGDNKALIESAPGRFYMPAYVGSRGWVGIRLDVGDPDWEEVRELLLGSYLLTAPKTLVANVSGAAAPWPEK